MFQQFLTPEDCEVSAEILAPKLIGKVLLWPRIAPQISSNSGSFTDLKQKSLDELWHDYIFTIIAETEAYTQEDPASHSHRGPTQRNKIMFNKAGRLYVYQSYGIHFCANLVAEKPGKADAVLFRSLIPLNHFQLIDQRRFKKEPKQKKEAIRMRGPGNLAKALNINKSQNGLVLNQDFFIVEPNNQERIQLLSRVAERLQKSLPNGMDFQDLLEEPVLSSKRIGISKAVDKQWRFSLGKSSYISAYTKI
jgi:DNA-3-methyladenine glycosylase